MLTKKATTQSMTLCCGYRRTYLIMPKEYIKYGGATQSRTGLTGFAIRGITDLLSRHIGKIL